HWRRACALVRVMLQVYRCEMLSPSDIEGLEEALDGFDAPPPAFHGFFHTVGCIAAHQALRLSDSRRHAADAIRALRAVGSIYGEIYIELHLAMIAGLEGETTTSNEHFLRAGAMIRRSLSYDEGVKLVHDILSAEVRHEHEPDDAKGLPRLTSVAAKLLSGEAWIDVYAASYRTLADKLFLTNRHQEALHVLDTVAAFAAQNGFENLIALSACHKAVFLMLLDRVEDGARLIRDAVGDEVAVGAALRSPAPWRVHEAVAEACLHHALATNRSSHREEIAALRDVFCERGDRRSAARLSALLAATAREADCGDHARLLDRLLQGGRFARSVTFVASPLKARMDAFGREPGYGALSAALERAVGTGSQVGRDVASLVSQKELAVIRGLSKGKTDKEIALEIGVTEHTVRYHLKNLFAKFNASSRLEALRRAEALGLTSGS
ncbi:MAG: helix-turn-helix transcriptional regulator, partial [Caulobacterales bacterium]|nr:helix-turn-helix transcriptional regulator [Caulobacterales bacterium]